MPSLRDFRSACHDAARNTGGSVVEFRLAEGQTPNFHQGLIAYRDRTVAVVWMREAEFLAVAEPRVVDFAGGARESGPLEFVEAPALLAALATAPGFRVLTPAVLGGPFDAAAWPGVLAGDVAYWRPANVGEAIFNYWD